MAQKLFIGGLSFNTTNEGLREFFAQIGNVTSASVVTDQFSGRSRGFGFVEMATPEEAEQAVRQLNGRELDGRQLKVEMAKSKGSGAGAAGGYRREGGGGGGRGNRW
jgi:RNA recognition motif-containing protein